jgi:hypothetical protein
MNGPGSYMGLTLTNPASQPSLITVDAFDPQGYATDTATLTLAPNTGWSGLLSQLLPGTAGQTGGRVHITASSLILAMQIWGSTSTGALAVVPPQSSVLAPQASGQLVFSGTGGTVISTDGSASLAIPPGALNQDTPVRITPLSLANFPQPSSSEHLVGVVEGTPNGTHFRMPVRLRFPLSENLQPGSTVNLWIFNPTTGQFDPSEFVATVDQSGQTASADVTHFTQFGASVSSVKVSSLNPSSGPVGTLVTITGSGFSLTPSSNTVLFTAAGGGTSAVPPSTATSTSLTVNVPSGAASGKVYVKVGSVRSSNGVRFPVTSPSNQAAVVTPIMNQTVTLPSGIVLSGSATDDGLPNGTLTATWSVVSGPGTVTFGTPTASTSGPAGQSLTLPASTAASFSATGDYDIRVTFSDGTLTSSDDVIITVNSPALTNQPPVVNAGANQTITLPASANLTGTATDDGLPNGTLTAMWSKLSGPGTVTFADPTAFTTTATFSVAGTYTLQLQASDGQLSSTSSTTVTVNISITPAGPVVSAGANQTIALPSSATLSGTVTDSCLPKCTLTVNWSVDSGPGTVTFGNSAALTTTATFSSAGTYVLRLTASDGALSSSINVTIVVQSTVGAKAWYVHSLSACANNGDGTGSNCAASSGAPGAWRGFSNINWSSSVHGGDVVYLIAGDTYQEGIIIGSSGTAGNPITVTVTNSGSPAATIDSNNGSYVPINTNGNSYITIDGIIGNAAAGDQNYGLKVTNSGTNVGCIQDFSAGTQIKVFHIDCSASQEGNGDDAHAGIRFQAASQYEIAYNWIHGPGPAGRWHLTGIICFCGTGGTNWDDVKIHHNKVEYMYHDGIDVGNNTSVYNNWTHRIDGSLHSDSLQCEGGSYCQIYNNFAQDNGDQSIYLDNFSGSTRGPLRVYNNVIASIEAPHTAAFGVVMKPDAASPWNDIVIANNTFFDLQNEAIRKSTNSVNNLVVLNNIIARRNLAGYQIDFTDSLITFADANAFDYQVYMSGSADYPYLINDLTGCNGNGAAACSLTQLQTLTSPLEVHGKLGNPIFINAAGGDFHLAPTDTIATGAARNLYSQYPFLQADKDGNSRPSSGGWDVGAFVHH